MRYQELVAGCGLALVLGTACGRVERSFDGGDNSGGAGGTGGGPDTCGDGHVDPGETCEDGNRTDGDGCDSNCTPTACGNGVVSKGETCDDGNTTDGDGCDSNCAPTGCGNGAITTGETCDDGNAVDGDGCDKNCTPTGCGNGAITTGETCDDGNPADGDGCDSNCTPTGCGNGVITRGEICDGAQNCRPDCAALVYLPHEVRGIRRISGQTLLLGFLAVKAGTEDRTVAEFNLSDLPMESKTVQLAIDLDDIDPGGPEGSIEVYWFSGDGVVNPDAFDAGTLFGQLSANLQFQTLRFDVSNLVSMLRGTFTSYLGFRISTTSADRYWLDQGGALPPRLEVLGF